jgi:hypothetical protein
MTPMFTRTLLAGTAAAIVAIGALGATTTAASAFPQHQNGRNWQGDAPGNWDGNGPRNWDGDGPANWKKGGPGMQFGFGGDGWYFKYGQMHPHPKPLVVEKVCSPTYKTIKTWKPYQGWVWQTVYNGQTCQYVPVQKNWQPHDWQYRD